MKFIWLNIKKHQAAIIAYMFYLLFWWLNLDTQINYHNNVNHLNDGERIAWGEGVMYWYLLTYAVSIGSTLVMVLNIALNKEDRLFYFIIALLIIAPLLIYISKYGLSGL